MVTVIFIIFGIVDLSRIKGRLSGNLFILDNNKEYRVIWLRLAINQESLGTLLELYHIVTQIG